MSLFVRVNCNFYTHRKTAKLRALIGDDALWLVPKWWAYAAENQPDGIFKDYSPAELAMHLGYVGAQRDPSKMVTALLNVGFADPNPLRIHDWAHYNAYHQNYSVRGKKGAEARWQKESTKEKENLENRGEKSVAMPQALHSAYKSQSSSRTGIESPPLQQAEKIRLEKSLDRVIAELATLSGSGLLPGPLQRKKTLQTEKTRLLSLLGLNV